MLGQNIKILREFYGETQAALAERMGLTEGCISRWESGERCNIKPEYLEWLSKYYRVSMDDLVGGNLEHLKGKKVNFNLKKLCSMQSTLYPIIKTDEALRDANFKEGYLETVKIMEQIKDSHEPEIERIENALECYDLAWKTTESKEAVANTISLLLLLGNAILYGNAKEIAEKIKSKTPIGKETIKKAILKDSSRDRKVLQERENIRKEFVVAFDKDLNCYIRILKMDSMWYDLGDFFVALRYLLGLANTSHDEQMSVEIGVELMTAYASIGNKYAKKLLLAVREMELLM